MSTKTTRIVPAFINVLTYPGDAVEDVASLTLTAIRAQQVDATMTDTNVLSAFTFININTSCAIFIEVISSATVNRGPLADVGANCVDTDLPSVAWARLTDTFIDVNAVSKGILYEPCTTLDLWETAE